MKILGIIPARGGSKRLPRKNLADLGGKPLIQWSIDTAIESKVFDKLFVSTEDEEIGKIAGELWWKRDPLLAKDDTPSIKVVEEILDKVDCTVSVLLQPTSPFRSVEDIQKSLKLIQTTNADSVFSTKEGPKDLAYQMGWANRLRSVPDIVMPNGSLFLLTTDAFRRGEDWFTGNTYGYPMPKERSLDIDTPWDLELANMMIKNGMHKPTSRLEEVLK